MLFYKFTYLIRLEYISLKCFPIINMTINHQLSSLILKNSILKTQPQWGDCLYETINKMWKERRIVATADIEVNSECSHRTGETPSLPFRARLLLWWPYKIDRLNDPISTKWGLKVVLRLSMKKYMKFVWSDSRCLNNLLTKSPWIRLVVIPILIWRLTPNVRIKGLRTHLHYLTELTKVLTDNARFDNPNRKSTCM